MLLIFRSFSFFSDFTEDCVKSYKTILGTFEDYETNHIENIRKQLKSLKQAGCKSSKKSRKAMGKQVKALEKRVKGWVSTVKSKLKKLIENRMTRLSQESHFNCERLNELRIASKGISSDVVVDVKAMFLWYCF